MGRNQTTKLAGRLDPVRCKPAARVSSCLGLAGTFMMGCQMDQFEESDVLQEVLDRVTRSLSKRWLSMDRGEVEESVNLGICHALQSYDTSRGATLRTWLGKAAWWWAFGDLEKKARSESRFVHDGPEPVVPDAPQFDELVALADDKYRPFLRRRYEDGMALGEVAATVGRSAERVRQVLLLAQAQIAFRLREAVQA